MLKNTNLASAARTINAKIIQLSSDDVFEGKTSGRLTEFDIPNVAEAKEKSWSNLQG